MLPYKAIVKVVNLEINTHRVLSFNRWANTVFALLLISAVVSFLLAFIYSFEYEVEDESKLLMMTTTILAIMILSTWYVSRKTKDYLNPFVFVTLTAFVGTVSRSFYIVFSDSPKVDALLKHSSISELYIGGAVILLGYVSFFVGYIIQPSRFQIEKFKIISNFDFSQLKLRILTVVILVLSSYATLKLLSVSSGVDISVSDVLSSGVEESKKRRAVVGDSVGVSGLSSLGYLRWLSTLLGPLFLVHLVFLGKGESKSRQIDKALFLALSCLVLVFPLLASSRALIQAFILQTIIALYFTNRVNIKGILIFFIIAILFLAVSTYSRSEGAQNSFSMNIVNDLVLDPVLGHHNYLGLVKSAHIVEAVPERMGYMYGASLVNWIFAPIPRSLWHDKPVISLGYLVTESVYGGNIIYGGGTPPGIIAEMFINFGYFGIVLGMLAFGVIISYLYKSFSPLLLSNPVALLLYLGWVYELSFSIFGGDVSRAMISAIRGVITFIILITIIRIKKRYKHI